MSHEDGRDESSENDAQAETQQRGLRQMSSLPDLGPTSRNLAFAVSSVTSLPDQSPRPAVAPSSQNVLHPLPARDRGYSLRRTLFAKKVQTTRQEGIETTEHTAPVGTSGTAIPEKNRGHIVTVVKSISSNDIQGPKVWLVRSYGARIWRLVEDFYTRTRKTILGLHQVPHSADGRQILINEANLVDERTQSPYIHNSIRSSRYSLISFFPRQLFAQFSKLANVYFLVISIMQMIPGLSTTGQFTTIVPLLVFIGMSMAKEGWDDVRRWRLDREENSRSALVLNRGEHAQGPTSVVDKTSLSETHPWTAKKWSEIKVGDIVRLGRDDQVPADLILMYAEGGTAYMETMALDGETNLKNKQPPVPLLDSCKTLGHVSQCQGKIVVEDPSMDLYRFEGKLCIAEQSFPLTTSEIMYRGSILRNTPFVAGIVCYTGEECRIRQNANKNPRIKAPALQALVNKIVLLIAGFVVVLSLGCAFGYSAWDSYEDTARYLQAAGVKWGHVLASFIIMFNTLLPLSLYVSMEIVKLIQIALMNSDVDMFDEVSNTPMQCQTSTINEELGQISYIFSDKTGTLTKNEMKFKKLSCGGYTWHHENNMDSTSPENWAVQTPRTVTDKLPAGKGTEQVQQPLRKSAASSLIGAKNSGQRTNDAESFPARRSRILGESISSSSRSSTRQLIEYIYKNPLAPLSKKVRFFILSIALCNTCIPERKGWSDEISYQATSPDELALITAAQEMGYLLVNRDSSAVTIKIFWRGQNAEPTFETYEILHVIAFTSLRKRMSVVVREPDGRVCVHCKGADTVIRTLLRLSQLAATHVKAIEQRVNGKKSLEAQEALRRRSTAPSLDRSSFAANEAGRRSGKIQQKASVRRSVDQWLSGREADTASLPSSPATACTPFPRPTSAPFASHRSSMQQMTARTGLDDNAAVVSSNSLDVKDFVDDGLISNESWVMEQTLRHVNDFANHGLRTLLHAARYLDEEEYHTWADAYREATTSLSNREARISEIADLVERQFDIIGATAIEDRLQDGVPDAIDRLRRANIKLWMLTGDKRETAISISRSCKLAKDYSTFIILDHVTGHVERRIANALLDISQGAVAHGVLVVEGETLASIENDAALTRTFLDLAVLVDSVICCRASPSQKATLVKSIRHRVHGAVTLAIGDGANDVAMIQEADVGIGISGGKEGLQAARTSDYSIAQFRFLCKLLLVHGRYNYIRISKYILGTTYKEMVFYLTQALYQRNNGYTGTSLYEGWSLSWYNTLFTSLPIIFLGAFMADLSPVTLLAVPELYIKGQRKGGFNFRIWLWWTFLGAVEAVLVFFIMYGIYARTNFTLDNGLFAMGVMTYSACVIIVNVKLQVLEIHNKTILAAIAVGLSLGAWFGWNAMLSAVYKHNVIYNVKSGFLDRFGRNALWWLTLVVIVLSFLLFELAIKALKAAFFPSDTDLFQVFEQDGVLQQRFEDSAAPLLQQARNLPTESGSLDHKATTAVDAEKEAEIEVILQNRASSEHERSPDPPGRAESSKVESAIRKSIDVFSKGFGPVKKEHLH